MENKKIKLEKNIILPFDFQCILEKKNVGLNYFFKIFYRIYIETSERMKLFCIVDIYIDNLIIQSILLELLYWK